MLSLCSRCYSIVTSKFVKNLGIWLEKECHICGNQEKILIDKSESVFNMTTSVPYGIYDGILIDITGQCNLSCKYCYHDRLGDHVPILDIVDYAEKYKRLAPFILSGGEPTLHPDIVEIIERLGEIAPVMTLTNGTNAIKIIEEIGTKISCYGNVLPIALSMHEENGGIDFEVLDYVQKKGLVLISTLSVVGSKDQVCKELEALQPYRDNIATIRIKAATNTGCTLNVDDKLTMSDLVEGAVKFTDDIVPVLDMKGTHHYFNVLVNGGHVAFVVWADVPSIIFDILRCGPYYECKDGNIYNLAETLVRNSIINQKAREI